MSEWKPIETAPKDGQSILAFHPHDTGGGRIITMLWNEKRKRWLADVHSFVAFDPTHWMPLPDPPQAAATAGEA